VARQAPEASNEASDAPAAPAPPPGGVSTKSLVILGVVVAAVWAFAIYVDSLVLYIIVGVLTALLAAVLVWAFRTLKKQRRVVSLLQGSVESPEARRDALAKLSAGKDANSPTNLFARAQLLAAEDPAAAIKLIGPYDLKTFPPAMQDDVSLLKAQLYLNMGRTADARKSADSMNLDNPQRKEIKAFASVIVAEAWARTGKPKEAIALLDKLEVPKGKDSENIVLQGRIARVFARFAMTQRNQARTELVALADDDPNYLGKFVMPQFKVHPELQKLARQVLQEHPAARKQMKIQTR